MKKRISAIMAKYLPYSGGLTEFKIRDCEPLNIKIGDQYEDNYFFEGSKFEIVRIDKVAYEPQNDDGFPYLVTGKCRVVNK